MLTIGETTLDAESIISEFSDDFQIDYIRASNSTDLITHKKDYDLYIFYASDLDILVELVGTCQVIQQSDSYSIITITDSAKERDQLALMSAGAKDFVVQPFDRKVLVARAKNQLDFLDLQENARNKQEKSLKK